MLSANQLVSFFINSLNANPQNGQHTQTFRREISDTQTVRWQIADELFDCVRPLALKELTVIWG